MSIKVMSLVWDHSDHKGSALLLMLALADFSDEDGVNIFPSVGTLAKKCRMTPRNVQILLHRLTASGELTIESMTGPYGTNQYRVMTAVLTQKPAKTFRAKSFRIRNSDQGEGEKPGSPGVIPPAPDPLSNHQQPSEDHYTRRVEELAAVFPFSRELFEITRRSYERTCSDPARRIAALEEFVARAKAESRRRR